MPTVELSGQINGLIILSSLSFAVTQYVQNRQRERQARIRSDVENIRKILYHEAIQEMDGLDQFRDRFDVLAAKRIRGFALESISLFVILCLTAGIKATDSISEVLANGRWHTPILMAIAVVSTLFFILIVTAGAHAIIIRTRTFYHERDIRQFRTALRMANPRIDEL